MSGFPLFSKRISGFAGSRESLPLPDPTRVPLKENSVKISHIFHWKPCRFWHMQNGGSGRGHRGFFLRECRPGRKKPGIRPGFRRVFLPVGRGIVGDCSAGVAGACEGPVPVRPLIVLRVRKGPAKSIPLCQANCKLSVFWRFPLVNNKSNRIEYEGDCKKNCSDQSH